jgi:glycosyltransferase involved in cell wall biosynthesis
VSVVVASLVGPPFIDDCLASLESEALTCSAEVVVVACGTSAYAQRLRDKFPWVTVVHVPERRSVPALRRIGIEKASGEVVAIIEEHCVAAAGWLGAAVAAHKAGSYAAVGGPVMDDGYRRIRDWVVYLCEYNGSLPPAPDGETSSLNGANIAYRRSVLIDHAACLDGGYWEASLHPVLHAEGLRFRSVPNMLVHHRGPFDFGYYLRQRFWFSRAFAGARRHALSLAHRIIYLVAAPVLPVVLLARIGWRVWEKKRYVRHFVGAVPLMIPALAVFVAGEWVGYVAGSGDALSKVE